MLTTGSGFRCMKNKTTRKGGDYKGPVLGLAKKRENFGIFRFNESAKFSEGNF